MKKKFTIPLGQLGKFLGALFFALLNSIYANFVQLQLPFFSLNLAVMLVEEKRARWWCDGGDMKEGKVIAAQKERAMKCESTQ